jgi:putative ABC transport system ATP-binding protein
VRVLSLVMQSVGFSYPGRDPVLTGLDVDVWERDFVVITGPSGGGKTTFLKLLCRLESPTRGQILYRGTPLEQLPAPRLRRRVAYLQQVPVVLPGTVAENLLLPFRLKENSRPLPSAEQLRNSLALVGLDEVALDSAAEELSVGQKQRLCLVRALLMQPDVLLLDEPLSALDAASVEKVAAVLSDLARDQGVTIVMASHAGALGLPGNRGLRLANRAVSEEGRGWVR